MDSKPREIRLDATPESGRHLIVRTPRVSASALAFLFMQNPQTETSSASPNFFGLGIAPKILDVIQRAKYTTPTPIQHQAIPIGIEGKDVIGIAQTGTGKTLAFAIPMIQRLSAVKGRGLILLPTRELALQVEETLQKIGRPLGLRSVVLIGGASMHRQIAELKRNPHVIVATPGRLIDHLDQKTVTVLDIKVLVLDEADRMLDMGFAPQIDRILATVPKDRQTLLFSATMPAEITKIVNRYMAMPVRIEVVPPGTTADRVEQEMFFVHKMDKPRLLEKILAQYKGPILVFSRTKFGARKLARSVKAMGHTTADIHSDRSLAQRRDALEGFKTGKYRVLIATDIAARGIDVKGIELVINYDLPDQSDDYVHRIGRTARAGSKGKAISFAMPDQKPDVKAIERLVRRQISVLPLPMDLPAPRIMPSGDRDRDEQRHYGGRNRFPRREGGNQGRSETHEGIARAPRAPLPGERRGFSQGGYRGTRDASSATSASTTSRAPFASKSGFHKGGPRGKRPHGPKMNVHEDQYGGASRPKKGPRKFYGGMGI